MMEWMHIRRYDFRIKIVINVIIEIAAFELILDFFEKIILLELKNKFEKMLLVGETKMY